MSRRLSAPQDLPGWIVTSGSSGRRCASGSCVVVLAGGADCVSVMGDSSAPARLLEVVLIQSRLQGRPGKSLPLSAPKQEASLRVIRKGSLTHGRCPSSGGAKTAPLNGRKRRPRHRSGVGGRASNFKPTRQVHFYEAVTRGPSQARAAKTSERQPPCRSVTRALIGRAVFDRLSWCLGLARGRARERRSSGLVVSVGRHLPPTGGGGQRAVVHRRGVRHPNDGVGARSVEASDVQADRAVVKGHLGRPARILNREDSGAEVERDIRVEDRGFNVAAEVSARAAVTNARVGDSHANGG